MSNLAYTITDRSITFIIDCKTYTVSRNDDKYDAVLNAIRNQDFDSIPGIMDIKGKLISESNGGMYLINGRLHCANYEVPTLLATRIVEIFKRGVSVGPISRFLENLMENPRESSREELYGFIEACTLPITDDGHFLAYKMVKDDFKDIYTGKIDNSVGAIVEMPRDGVDDNRNNTCSSGLHFCSEGYLGHYGTETSSRLVVLKINPRDVVSIPTDYNNAKGRACRYEVVDTLEWSNRIKDLYTDEYSDDSLMDEIDALTDDDWDDWDDYLDDEMSGWDDSDEGFINDHPTFEGLDLYDDNLDDEYVESDYRWQVRTCDTGSLVDSWTTRSQARDDRNSDPSNLYIWDSENLEVVAGSPVPSALPTYKAPTPSVPSGAVLTEDHVREIRGVLDDGKYESIASLARDYEVSERTIRRIRDRESWVGIEPYQY